MLLSVGPYAFAEFQFQKSAPATATSGDEIEYTISVRNVESVPTDATVTDPLPAGTTFVSVTAPGTWTCTAPAVGANGTVECSTPALGAETTELISIVVDTDGIANGTMVTNTATVNGGGAEPRESSATTTFGPTDLAIEKTADVGVAPGGSILYTIFVSNNGPSDTAAAMTDHLPSGTTFISITTVAGWTCTTPAVGSGGTVQCTTPVLPRGEGAQFDIVVGVPADTPNGTSFTNTATVSGPLPDPNSGNDSSTAITVVNDPSAVDLSVTKSGPATATAGSTITYAILVQNFSGDDALDVTLTDVVPTNTTFVSFTTTAPGWVCTTGGTNTCTKPTFGPGESAQFTLVVTVDAVPAGTVISNTASVTTASSQTNTADDSSTIETTIVEPTVSSLNVTITDSPDPIAQGQDLTYVIQVSNEGPDPASNVTLAVTPPSSTTIQSVTPPAGWTCTSGSTIFCSTETLAVGTAEFTVVVRVSDTPTNGEILVAIAEVGEESATTTTTVQLVPDLDADKTGPANVNVGDDISWTITVTNTAIGDAGTVQFTDTLPAQTTFVSLDAPAGWTCTTGATIQCSAPSLAAGATATFTLVADATTAGSITNTANFATAGDPDTSNNSASANTTIAQPDAAVTKVGPASVVVGDDITWTITVTNDGTADTGTVTLNDVLPSETTFVSLDAPAGWTCTTGSTVNCSAPSLAAGANATFTLVANAMTEGVITNTATVAAVGDVNTANDSATATTTIAPTPPDLDVDKTGPAAATVGDNITWTITITNLGGDATTVTLNDVLPAGTTFVSLAEPAGWTCTTGSTIDCSTPSFAGGATATFTLVANAPTEASITNTATVATTGDSDGTNDSASATTNVVPPGTADLAIMKTGPLTALEGSTVTYTITATNNGPADATNVTLTDVLEAPLVAFTPAPGWTCTTGTTISCTIATFVSGATAVFTLSVTAPDGPATLTNTATIESDVSTDASSTATTAIAAAIPAQVPTLSTWMLMLMVGLLAAVALRHVG
ncbi:MAG TPA: IPTL-CTERM sorting domain-containing protein [Thermoanaerobaculia bacterium]|jgi:uncharacterized repeat protein (TIGR01451 family)|nr:IPTL-CTERM sorting domain-containing protein [Thermoanaerobaculia bacterium]